MTSNDYLIVGLESCLPVAGHDLCIMNDKQCSSMVCLQTSVPIHDSRASVTYFVAGREIWRHGVDDGTAKLVTQKASCGICRLAACGVHNEEGCITVDRLTIPRLPGQLVNLCSIPALVSRV